MRLLTISALVALMLVAVSPEANGKGGTAITACGQTVMTNAVLGQNLNCPTGSGTIVGASGITINLNGHRITGVDGASTYGVDDSLGFDNITVENGTLSEFENGINAFNADHFAVKKVVASGNVGNGVTIAGDSASITSLTAPANEGGFVINGDHASVKSSTADDNFYGLRIDGGGAKLISSTASGNSSSGMVIMGDAASVKSSAANGNGILGIEVDGDAAKLSSNTANGNGYIVHDHVGLGLTVSYVTVPPVGKNSAAGNDDQEECNLTFLCQG